MCSGTLWELLSDFWLRGGEKASGNFKYQLRLLASTRFFWPGVEDVKQLRVSLR